MKRLRISESVNRYSAMGVTVEEATVADVEPIGQLLKQLFAIEADFTFEPTKARKGLELLLEEAGACVLTAKQSGQVIGMCTAQKVISTAEGGYSVWVEDLVVDHAHRGKGVGRQLLDAVCDWAWRQGAKRMQLLADDENEPAKAFYRKNGWRRTRLTVLRSTADNHS